MADILPFRRADECDECRRPMKRAHPSNDPAYCSHVCGAKAQPDKVIAAPATNGRFA